MADWYSAFYDEFKALVQTTWPEITDSKFFTSIQALRENILDTIQRGEQSEAGYADLPWAVVQIGDATNDDTWGLQNRMKRSDVKVWYINRLADTDVQKALHAKLWALGEAVDDADHTTFEPVETCSIETGESSAAMDQMTEGKIDLIAGSVFWTPGFILGDTG